MIANLRIAIGFLTRIPVSTPEHVVLSAAAPWFPAVGLGIGLIQAGALVGFHALLPAAPAAVLSVAVAALITGAFHHDGLADMADAFGGGWTVEQRLEIMKDSRLGTYGTAALVLAFATEISVLASLGPAEGAAAVIAAHCLSRAVAVAAMRVAPLANPGGSGHDADDDGPGRPALAGLGAAYAQDLGWLGTAIAVAFGIGVTAVAFTGWMAIPAVIAAVIAAVGVVALAVRKIGGITGDVLGAVQQMASLAVLLVAAASLAA